jgi:Zn-dependent protease with chaperone function
MTELGFQIPDSGFRKALLVGLAAIVFGATPVLGQTPHGDHRSGGAVNPPRSSARDEPRPVPVPEPSEKALHYYRSGNWLWAIGQAWVILLTGTLAFSGASARLRTLARRLAGSWFLTVGVYVIMYLGVVFLVNLPLAFYRGFIRQHAYGLSNQTLAKWFGDAIISLGVTMVVGFLFAWVPYLLLARSPRRWWLYTALLSVPFLFLTMLVEPIWIDPLFNKFGPMKDKALERSILALAERAGISGSRVFEVEKSVDTKAVNAYVTGVFGAKRIVLWDTLIAKVDEPELLFVMGHEMGHYVLGHVVRSILLGSLVVLAGLFFVDRVGRWLIARYSGRLGFDRLSDVASVPLVLMLMHVGSWVLGPMALAYSRYQEHEADRFALELTRANHDGAMSFVKMQAENLGNPRPGWLYKLFRSTHPSTGERIDFCNTYHPWRWDQSTAAQGDRRTHPDPEPGG